MAVFPLQAAAKVIGTINFYANEVNYFGEEERELYNELVKDISFALEMLENEESLRNTHAFNEMLLQTIPFGMDIVDERGTVLFMNTAMKNIFVRDDAGQLCWSLSKNGKKHCLHCPLQKGIEISRIDILESMNALDGRIFQIHLIGIMFRGKKAMLELFADTTEQRKLQNRLLQDQKIQSIGTLAGGIAHDFNNILETRSRTPLFSRV